MNENKKPKLSPDLNGLFQSAKARVIAFIVGIAVIIAIVAGVWHHISTKKALEGAAQVGGAPPIESIPGAGNPSDNYVAVQNTQNVELNKKARQEGTSSLPTITRASFSGSTEAFENAVENIGKQSGKRVCPLSKTVYMYRPNPANCTVPNLQLARQAGVTAEELLCQACSCPALRAAGYTAGELKDVGLTATDLKKCGYSLKQLIQAGFSAADLKKAGFTAAQLKNAGFTAGQLAAAGFTPDQIKAAGYTAQQMRDAGIVPNKKECSIEALKRAHAAGVSASELKACGLAALKAAGYTAAQLKAAGFTAAQLKDAGFTAAQLKDAGFTAKQLADAGFSAGALKDAGFTAAQLRKAGFNAAQLKNAGFTDAQLKAAGYSPDEIKAADVADLNCSVSELRRARAQGVSAKVLKKRGCPLSALKAAGFTSKELKDAGFTAAQLKDAGFSAKQLKDAGFSDKQLADAGFSPAQVAGASSNVCSVANLRKAREKGVSAAVLKARGCGLSALKAAGFTAKELKDAGFSAAQLKAAGFSAKQLKDAGFSAGDLKAAGFSAQQLKDAGFSAKQLRDAGFSAAQLKTAGFTPSQLLKAGFTKGDLLRAGFTAAQSGYHSPKTPVNNSNPVQQTTNETSAQSTIPSIEGNSQAARIRALQAEQQRMMNAQQREDEIQTLQGNMMMESQRLMSGWSNTNTQNKQISTVVDKSTSSKGSSAESGSTGPVIKAGTILYAVLDTGVDSDDVSTPVMATIISGELKGAKLIGAFTRENKHVLIKFSTINVPSFEHTFSGNLVAIDPRTAQAALSGYVNNHYLLKYGSLFASAFLSGISEGIINSSQDMTCFGFICTRTTKNLTPTQYVMLGLGKTGSAYASVMSSNFSVPPTIKIPGGQGIGILVMSDLTLPQPLPTKHIGSVEVLANGE